MASLNPDDPYNLQRFLDAQADCYDDALAELRAGRKRSHWMWFIFPQCAGLGFSAMAQTYAIQSRAEAQAYLDHPILGPRLTTGAEAMLQVVGRTAQQILGTPDDLKMRSCATLFAAIAPAGSVFHRLLDTYYRGQADPQTLAFLSRTAPG